MQSKWFFRKWTNDESAGGNFRKLLTLALQRKQKPNMMRNAFLLCSAILLLVACQPENPNAQTLGFDLISPAFPGVKVPSETQSMDPAKGDTLKFALGAEVRVPANALVNAKGEAVEGTVDIRFRQYVDPLDMAIAGINMQYDSAGSSFTFESAGMCEVRAFQNGQEVFLKEGARLGMDLPSPSAESDYNLYVYDTVRQRWTYLEEDIETTKYQEIQLTLSGPASEFDWADSVSMVMDSAGGEFTWPEPQKLDETKVQIEVEVPDHVELPELKIFNATQFEILPEDTVYRDEHSQIEWNWAEVEATDTKGEYRLVFSRGNHEVAYLVRPVYEGKDYEEALAIYQSAKIKFDAEAKKAKEEAQERYEAAQRAYEARLKQERKKALALYLEDQRKGIERQIQSSKEERIARTRMNRAQAEAARQQALVQSRSLQQQAAAWNIQYINDQQNTARLVRRFAMNNFGTYNCDRVWTSPNEQVIVITYLAEEIPIRQGRIDFVMSQSNVKTTMFVGGSVALPTDEAFSIFSIRDNQFYYLPLVELKDLPRTKEGDVILKLKKFDGPLPQDYETARKLLEI